MLDFKNLQVWQKAHQLTLGVYRATTGFPSDEWYGLTSQIRRACASIPANIAEGSGRDSDADFARFLLISMGPASELEYHLLLAHDLGFLAAEHYGPLDTDLAEIKRMLNAFIHKLKAKS
jgi:four helix bundle protein